MEYALSREASVKKLKSYNLVFLIVISYWQLGYMVLFNDFLSRFDWGQLIFALIVGTMTFGILLVFSKTLTHFATKYTQNSYMKKHRPGDGILGEHLIELTEMGVTEVTDVNETQHMERD